MAIEKYKNPIQFWIHVFFFLIFCSVSLINHYFFRSAGLDYGIANQALYQYAHFKSAICTQLIGAEPISYLGLHFSLWVPILSPFYWLFGSYTLLIFQNLALIFGGVGLVKMANHLQLKEKVALIVLVQFYSSFTIFSAIAFDYHDNVIGACFLPWLFYFYYKENLGLFVISFLAILLSKENMAIWLIFISIGFYFRQKSTEKSYFKLIGVMVLVSIFWFLFSGLILMPLLNPNGKFEQLTRFSHLGSNLSEIIIHIISHPIKMIRMFVESHIQPDIDEVVKHEFLWAVLFSGGIILIAKPSFLWIALPIFMQKLWNKELAFWGVSYHYQIELAPIISLAILFWIKPKNNKLFYYGITVLLLLSTAYSTFSLMENRRADYRPEKENIFVSNHYKIDFDIEKVNQKINEIPANAKVCAQSNILPHLANRDFIYHFPYIKDAEYLLIMKPNGNPYPLSNEDSDKLIDSLLSTPYWKEDSSALPLRILHLEK